MIITRAPFRITLGGGGTDLPEFYRGHGGFVLAMAIDQYMHIMLHTPRVDDFVRLHYSSGETVAHVSGLKHDLAREALRYNGIERQIEVASVADLPAGTGVGSSGSYLVALLTAIHHYKRDFISLQALAEEACHIEMDILRRESGKQDPYLAAFGGLTALEIGRDGTVQVIPLPLGVSAVTRFVSRTQLYYTGIRRDAPELLGPMNRALRSAEEPNHARVTSGMERIAVIGRKIQTAIEREDFDTWGQLLHEHWEVKRSLSAEMSPPGTDAIYAHVRQEFGVLGGKIVGAGGGGFLMLYSPADDVRLESFMAGQGYRRLHYTIAASGADVVASFPTGIGPLASHRAEE